MSRRRPVLAVALAVAVLARPLCVAAASTEQDLGRQFLLEVRSQIPLVDDPVVTSYVERLGEKLVASLGPHQFDYHFYAVAHPALNAFSVPGGYVFVFSGLLARAATESACSRTRLYWSHCSPWSAMRPHL